MNQLQRVLLDIIYRIANVEDAFEHGDDVLYGLKNYVARHSLANDLYFVSEQAFAELQGVGISLPILRGKVNKRRFTFEHPVPVHVVAEAIQESGRTRKAIAWILDYADCVTVVTKEEDRRLSRRMPAQWKYFQSSQFGRYEEVGISIRREKVRMRGAVVR